METESAEQGQVESTSRTQAGDATDGSGESSGGSTRAGESSESQRSKIEDASGSDAQELEWQFEAGDLEEVESWLDDHESQGGLTVAPGVTKNLTDSYYDTEDSMLYRAGYALRIRQRGKSTEATMKSIAPATDGLRQRRELSEAMEDGGISTFRESGGKVGERLRLLTGRKELQKLFEVNTRRRVFELSFEDPEEQSNVDLSDGSDSVVFGEIALDETEIPLGSGEEPAKLSRVEIEAASEALTRDVRHLVEEMRSAHRLSPARISKYEAGLYATGIVPEDQPELGSTHVDASLSTGEVAYAVLRRQFARLQHHEPGVRLGEDPEAVHDMRVASRRMRAAIKLFREALPERALWLESELKWLAGGLGDVRDLDVELEELNAWAASEEASEEKVAESTRAFEGLIEAVEEQRGQARERMLQALDSARYERLIASFTSMLRRGPARSTIGSTLKGSKAGTRITTAAPRLLSRRYKKFRKAAGRIREDGASAEDYHELRKKGKSLRYALEFHREVYGSPVKNLIRPLKSLQDDLGRHQDTVVAAKQLRDLSLGVDHGLSSESVFAMGAYAERYRREGAELRVEIPRSKAFRNLSSRATQKELEKKLDKRR